MRILKFTLTFSAIIFLGISKVYAQRADAVPIIKYAVNNFAAISKACDTCLGITGTPLMKNRPIPLPEVSAFDALTGLDPKYIPGIIAPNFIGGGSPEIKGLVKNVAGMTERYAKRIRKTDILYFRYGAKGVAINSTGKIVTASSTILPGYNFDDQQLQRGFFSFKSTPQRIPVFNSTSEQVFEQSSKQFIYQDGSEHTFNMEVIHFVIDPKNDDVVYASLRNPEFRSGGVLARKDPDSGNWEILESDVPGELDGTVWGALAMDRAGNLYVADPARHIIVKIGFDDEGNVASRQIIGGQPDTPGFANDEDGQDARFNKPSGICLDAAGNIYIGDAGNNRVRKIDTDNGEVTTYAGSGEKGFEDDQDWAKAKFWDPTAVAYNEKTKALYVVDFGNRLIREILTLTDQDREVSTLAGNAGSLDPREPARFAMTFYYIMAQLNLDPDESKLENPTGIVIDPEGYGLYVSDGLYVKYVNTFQAKFEVTGSYRDPKSKIPIVGTILPPGIVMNPNNGTFFGVPVTTWEPTTYTIRATNSVDRSFINGAITFEVVECPDVADTIRINTTISPKQLPYVWNGHTLTGAGTAVATLQSSQRCDSLLLLTLTVRPEFNYTCDPYTLSLGLPINPIIPATSGAKMDSFFVNPPLPAGLTINVQTGAITGTPTEYTTPQLFAAVGPKTPQQYAAPWTLQSYNGADLTQVQILDCSQKVYFENNTGFKSLQGSAGTGTGTAGAYSDFSGLGPIKMTTNTPYTFRLDNALADGYVYSLNTNNSFQNFMNSYAVYIDYNRDGDFADAGERVYRSAAPQRDAHAEVFNLNIPTTATSGVTKMRIYVVEAATWPTTYQFKDANGRLWDDNYNLYTVTRTTEQALSFYPFFNDISYRGEQDFSFYLDYGEFEDYNIEIENPVTQTYLVKGRNALDSAEAVVKISVNDPTRSTTNLTICSTELPYKWNNLSFSQSGSQTATLENSKGADSLATLNLVVKLATLSENYLAHCGTYNFHGQMLTESGLYGAKIANAAGCDSLIYLSFRQKATASQTDVTVLPNQLPYFWNGIQINTAGTYAAPYKNWENCDSTARLTLRVQYNIYYTTNNLSEINKPIVAIRPQIEGAYMPAGGGYSISPALPVGLYLDPTSGVISGTPTQLSPIQTYTITLRQDGAQPTTLTFSVGKPTVSTTTIDNCGPFTWNEVVYNKPGTYITSFKNQYGFDSTATLVLTMRSLSASTTDLFLNYSQLPFGWNGDSIKKEGLHTVILSNSVGCDSAATANVVISPKINYVSPKILQPNRLIAPITPQNLGGKPVNYAITPSLVRGLQFDAASGVIFGTPADSLLQPITHTVRAANGAGSDTAKLVIAVCNAMATSFTKDTCDQYIWNDSTYTVSTIHTRILKNRGGCDSTVTMNLIIRKSSKGVIETITACSSYTWYGVNYDTTGVYTKVFPNAVGCDSTLTLNLTVNYPSVNNLYVNLNASDLPYKWRNKTFTAPGSDTVLLRNGNSVGCDSTVRMTVSISAMLPDITYAVTDTILYWEKTIETPIAMSNTGTALPAMKIGERDSLIKFTNGGPGNFLGNTVKGPNGTYYSRVDGNSNVYKLSPSGEWTVFANVGSSIKGLAIDTSGNLYVATNSSPDYIKKITPDGNVGDLPGSPSFNSADNVFVDKNNVLVILESNNYTQLDIVKFNLSTGQHVRTKHDNSPYFDFGPEDMEVDSKGNIYIYKNYDNVVVKIRPDGRMSGIGLKGSDYSSFTPGNGPDATLPTINSMAIDPSNDNLYLMTSGRLLRVDTAENVSAITGRWFDISKDQIFRVENEKAFIITNATVPTDRSDPSPTPMLYTANVHGVGSLPFMDNQGAIKVSVYGPSVNFTDFDKRIRLDSSGSIVGTPRGIYAEAGWRYGSNSTTGYSIIAANEHGISKAPMVITHKGVTYKRESFVTTTLPFTWRGRSFTAATDTATYYVRNRLEVDDTVYMLHLVYEGPPEPFITSNCVTGGVSLAANGAAKSAIRFDGTTRGLIKNVQQGSTGHLGYYSLDWFPGSDGKDIASARTAFEVWIKPESVSGTQYLLTRDSVKTRGTFIGYSIQNGKFVYEFIKGKSPSPEDRMSSVSNIEPNVWTHVAASFYDSAMHIFINGKLDNTHQTSRFINPWYSVNDSTFETNSPDFFLGGLPGKDGYKGEMDELRLFDTKRNADSIKATMYSILDPTRGGLGLYYRFDGDITNGVPDVSLSGRTATFIKPATSVDTSGAPINFAAYNWTPGDSTTKSVIAKPTTNTTYKVTVTDYKGASASASLLVYPAQAPSITSPAAVTKSNSLTSCTVVVSDADLGSAIATDNCPGLIVKRTGVPAGNVFPVGITTITYTATSINGLTKSATQTVTVTDISKPVFTTALSAPSVVWPPDHKMKSVALTYATTDLCGTVTNKVTITSTDPITGASDGDISPDWIISNDHLVQLRAERGNGKEARIYTITVTPVDSSGNVGTPQSVKVTIAHNIIGPITGTSFKIGSTVNFSGVFWDKAGNKHTGQWVIDDNTVVKGIATEPSGTRNGKVTGSYKFTTAGTYKLKMNLTDQSGVTSYCNTNEDMEAIVVIYDPAGGYTYGGGWFTSRPGALPSNPAATGKVSYGFQSNYYKGATFPKGETQLEFKVGDLEFNALNFEYLTVAGAKAQFRGSGKIIGDQSGYSFIMTVIDGQINGSGVDKIRMKIFNKNTGKIIFDNQPGASDAADPTEVVGAGSVVAITGTNTSTTAKAGIRR